MKTYIHRVSDHVLWAGPVVALLLAWEFVGRTDPNISFFFSYPTAVLRDVVTGLGAGDLWIDVAYTFIPAAIGVTMGALVGGALGFALLSSPRAASKLEPLVTFLGAFPVFAIAPMTVVWFGLGLSAKLFLAFISCVFIFLQAAHKGGLSVPSDIADHFKAHGFSTRDMLLKVRLPFAMDWLLTAFKTGSNLALLGVFVGEFVASERGLARVMLNAGALYNVKRVLAAAVLFTLVAVIMMAFANLIHRHRARLLRSISVPSQTRS